MATAWFRLEISRSLTGATASAAADVAFDVTMSAGAAETVTTGGGADTVAARVTDNANTGAGNDTVTIGTDHTTGVVNGGAGTDTLAFAADRDISGSTTITALKQLL